MRDAYCPACGSLLQYVTAAVDRAARLIVVCPDCPIASELTHTSRGYLRLEDIANMKLEELEEPTLVITPLTRTAQPFAATWRES